MVTKFTLFHGTVGALRIKLLFHFFSVLFQALHKTVGGNVIRTERNYVALTMKQLIKPRASTARVATILLSNVLDHLSFLPRRVLARCGQTLCRKRTRLCITQSTPGLESTAAGRGQISRNGGGIYRRDPLTLGG
jgi:hypothetical protein